MDDSLISLVLLHNLVTQIGLIRVLLQDQERIRRRLTGVAATRRPRRQRRIWVAKWLQERLQQGAWDTLIPTLAPTHHEQYKTMLRMDEEMFDEILERLRPHITKQTTNFREPIEPGLRLAITLRFLATGDSFVSLSLLFRVHCSTIGKIIDDTCEAIVKEYMDEIISCPTTQEGWRDIARGFSGTWNFEHTVGAIDGKHIRIMKPPRTGSQFFNYKGFFSLVLLGVVDSNYKFIYASVGANGATCDAQVFFYSNLYRAMVRNEVGLPPPERLHGEQKAIPYFFVGDDAFALKEWMMKPFPFRGLNREQRVFNYHSNKI